uniref:BHLH domain-containing protein n=1 Tax=Strongyloides papillosus TaxID=174720 RepID=A0A0N5B5X1_STREA
MAGKERPSGAQYRKRKAENDKLVAELSGSFLKYLSSSNTNEEKCVQNSEISAAVANSTTTEADIHIEGSEEGKKTDNEVTVCDKDNLENEPPYRSREEDP